MSRKSTLRPRNRIRAIANATRLELSTVPSVTSAVTTIEFESASRNPNHSREPMRRSASA